MIKLLQTLFIIVLLSGFCYGQSDLQRPITQTQRLIIETYVDEFDKEIQSIENLYAANLICLEQKKAKFLAATETMIQQLEAFQYELSLTQTQNDATFDGQRFAMVYKPQ